MNFLDIILGVFLLWGLYRGFRHGLFVEIASLIALVVGIYGAIHFSYVTGGYLNEHVEWGGNNISILAFLITFILIIILVSFAGKVLTKIADFTMLGIFNKIAGAFFGLLKEVLILGALLIFLERSNNVLEFIPQETLEASKLYSPIKEIGEFVISNVLRVEVGNLIPI